MPDKYTYEFVYNYFKSLRHELLSKEYINCKTKLEYKCGYCGQTAYVTFDNLKGKNMDGCSNCRVERSSKSKRIKYDFIKDYIESYNCKLLTEENNYININSLIKIECNCGAVFENTFINFKSRVYKLCSDCAMKIANYNSRVKLKDIENELKLDGNILLKYFYKNGHNIKFKCSCGNIEEMTLVNYHNKLHKSCFVCSNENRKSKLRKYNIDIVKIDFEREDYVLISNEFVSIDSDLEYICPNGHLGITTYYKFLLNHRCMQCYREYNRGENHWNWQGGISSERDKIKFSDEYKNWRISVFQRDNYICQCCNQKGGKLHAHHIFNFSNHALLRFDINNGITLCEKCHSPNMPRSFHNLYGVRNNTTQQLEEYLFRYRLGEFNQEILNSLV